MAMADNKIEIRNLYKVFGDHAKTKMQHVHAGISKQELLDQHGHVLGLRDINIKVRSKRIQVIMGLSGTGKTTLIRHINRMIEPTEGERLWMERMCSMSTEGLRDFRRPRPRWCFSVLVYCRNAQ